MSIFSKVQRERIKRSSFNLSHERKLSGNMGSLMPIVIEEVLPKDSFRITTELLIKTAPLKAPVMHRINATVHYFFVPTYQVWDNFEQFVNPATTQDTVPPYLDFATVLSFLVSKWIAANVQNWEQEFGVDDFAGLVTAFKSYSFDDLTDVLGATVPTEGVDYLIGSLVDYFGLDLSAALDAWIAAQDSIQNIADSLDPKISSVPFRCYAHIWNEYYRDENLMDEIYFGREDGVDGADPYTLNLLELCYRCWKKDYFTSALPTPQAGDDVLLPIGGRVPVEYEGGTYTDKKLYFDVDNAASNDMPYQLDNNGVTKPVKASVDLSGVTGVSISELRKSVALQRFKELTMRGGKARYKELVASLFDAFLPDYYVDRPIFLGGQVQPISIGEVVQTSMTVEDSGAVAALGQRAGLGQSFGKTKTVFHSFPCHGYIIGLLSIRPEATYQQGIHRMWTRRSLFDYAFPQFAHIGEQEIYNRELVFSQSKHYNDGVFGYTPRYAEYKVGESVVCGQFRKSLDYWHFGRTFVNDGTNSPKLNSQFIQMSPDQMDYDPFAVTDPGVEHFYIDLYNHIFAKRPLPYFGTPKLI